MELTVIVPVYNVEKYLEECLNSLVTQTEDFDEIILINDGSIDNSREICEKYYRLYPSITLINQANRGLAAARNEGLKKATGDYVIFVDSDDYMRKESCEILKKALKFRKPEVLYYNADIQYDISYSENGNAFRHISAINTCCMEGLRYLEMVFPSHYTASSCVAAYSRRFLKKCNIAFPEGIYFEDNFFSLKVITCAEKIAGINDSLYIRRYRENSIMTSELTEKKCCDLVINQKIMWEYIANSLEWLRFRTLKIRIISFGILHTFFELSRYENKELVSRLKQELVNCFFTLYFSGFKAEFKRWDVSLAVLLLLKEVSYRIVENSKFIQQYYGSKECLCRELQHMELLIKEQCIEQIKSLPFNRKNMKIGIYGIGKHTQFLIDLYQKTVGAIRSEMFFIVSSKLRELKYMDREVVVFEEIPDDTDYIIVSSYVYQQEMYKNLLSQKIEKDRIFLLYTETSICDLIMMKWVMDY